MVALSPYAQEILDAAMQWMDSLYNGAAGLLVQPGDSSDRSTWPTPHRHMVRDSTYYALGLLMRAAPGDQARAERLLHAILDLQIDEPEAPYHGTFLRYREEPRPTTPGAREWRDYDPNWRDFIGTGFALILTHFEEQLAGELVQRLDDSLRKAVVGALARNLNPGYTNIALMDAYLLNYVGKRLGVTEWESAGDAFAVKVAEIFQRHNAFEEYNSPTYYGVNFYALALWRGYGQSAYLREKGAEMEALLWADFARFYHAGLRNVAGPWDRSYGTDMTRYVGLVGVWAWLAVGRDRAPVPDFSQTFYHSSDLCFGATAALVGTQFPDSALPHLKAFQSARRVEQRITDERVASAWLEDRLMLGAEHTNRSKQGYSQFHPLTIHWQMPAGQIGWVKLIHSLPVDVTAGERALVLEGQGEMTFHIYSPGSKADDLRPDQWVLSGLDVKIEGSAAIGQTQMFEDGLLEISYPAAETQEIRMVLRVTAMEDNSGTR